MRTSTDSGNHSGSAASSEQASPDSMRSFHSGSPDHPMSADEPRPHSGHDDIPEEGEDADAAAATRGDGEQEGPVDFSKPEPSTSAGSAAAQDRRTETMSILDSYLRADQSSLAHASASQLAAAHNLAWLSQQRLPVPQGAEIVAESRKENRPSATPATPPALPILGMDIADRLQKALLAANLNRERSWMSPAVHPGFAAVAAAAAASSARSPGPDESLALAQSPSPASGSLDLTAVLAGRKSPMSGTPGRGRGSFRGLGRPSAMQSAAIGPNGKPSVTCEVCGKRLADPSSLYRHRKIHSGEKPHECPYCGRKFIQRYNMTQHIKTHFKERGINSLAANSYVSFNAASENGSGSKEDDFHDEREDLDDHGENEEGFDDEDEEIEPC
jgi:hypothetical protein